MRPETASTQSHQQEDFLGGETKGNVSDAKTVAQGKLGLLRQKVSSAKEYFITHAEDYILEKIFWPYIDEKRSTGNDFEDYTLDDVEKSREPGITYPVDYPEGDLAKPVFHVENPMGKTDKARFVFFSDTHHQYSPETKREEALLTLGYKLIIAGTKLGYQMGEYKEKITYAIQTYPDVFRAICSNVLGNNPNSQRVAEIAEQYKDQIPPDVFKALWNVPVIIGHELRNHKNSRQVLADSIADIDAVCAQDLDRWMDTGSFIARNNIMEPAYGSIMEQAAQGLKEDCPFATVDLGDSAHSGGSSKDHLSMISKLSKLMNSAVKTGKKFFLKVSGNHDRDPREPQRLNGMLNLYGPQIFTQEITAESEENSVLIAAIDSFILSNEWKNVFEEAVTLNPNLNPGKLKEQYDLLQEMNAQVFKKIREHKGKVVILDHHAFRTQKYFEDNKNRLGEIIGDANITNIISGHTHHNNEYDYRLPNGKVARVNIVSGYIGVTPAGINAPSGIQLDVDNGIISIKILTSDKDELQKRFNVPVV